MKIGIIGAGMAGLSAATSLKADGHELVVYDKGRGPGGRMSARRARTPLGEARFDHGAQFFTARDPGFVAQVERWVSQGHAAHWDARMVHVDASGDSHMISHAAPLYVGTPAMNSPIRAMAEGLDITWASRATGFKREGEDWLIQFEDDGEAERVDALIVATPLEQARELLDGHVLEVSMALQDIEPSAPCWAVMLAFEKPLALAFDAARIRNGPLSRISRGASKPARTEIETLVLHASPDWSRTHLEADAETILADLMAACRTLIDLPDPIYAAAHRWRFAMASDQATVKIMWDADRKIGVCGDYCLGGRVEAAWLSGAGLAKIVSDG